MELALRNVAEPLEEFVMTLDELRELVRKGGYRVYVGYEPSGPVHVGTLVTVRKLRDMIEAGFSSIALMADIHAILNLKGPQELIREVAMTYWKTVFHELGSKEIEIKLGTDFELSEDYVMDLLTISQRVTARRAWRAMTMIAREQEDPYVSQMIYPLMQALDILYLGVRVAIGGTDQRKIHALTREIFNSDVQLRVEKYVPTALHTPLLPGLTGGKMSSSIPKSHVAVHDPPEVIREKVMNAYCPPGAQDQYDEEGKLKNPILAIVKHFILPETGSVVLRRSRAVGGGEVEVRSYGELEEMYVRGEIHPMDLKEVVADYLIEEFARIREIFESNKDLIEPLYRLQKWQKERGFFGEVEWREVLKSYKPYLGEIS